MEWENKELKHLIQAILSLKNDTEARNFLRDLMTESEISTFAKRLKAAEMLMEKVSYFEIEKETGLSSTTVARVAKWLNSEGGGYKTIIHRLSHHN